MQPASVRRVRAGLDGGRLLYAVAIGSVLPAGLALATTDLATLGTYVTFAAIGGLLVYYRPRNTIGWRQPRAAAVWQRDRGATS